MKVLFYNWAPLTSKGVGGGVAVYIYNVLQFLQEHHEKYDIDATFLSSGWMYDKRKKPYFRAENNGGGKILLSN